MPSPRISIGIPFWNSEATLPDAITSVLAQTFHDWELILLDDGSTDGSMRICQAVADSRVRAISDGKHLGLVERLNQIASIARGQILARMDSDDIMHPDRIAQQVDFIASNPGIDVVSTGIYSTTSEGSILGKWLPPAHGEVSIRPISHNCIMHPTVVARTRWFRDNPYDPEFVRGEDRELWCRAAVRGTRFGFIRRPLLFYRQPKDPLSKYRETARTVIRMVLKYGPEQLGWIATCGVLAGTVSKLAAYETFGRLGASAALVRHRTTKLPPAEEQEAFNLLSRIQSLAKSYGLAQGRNR